MTPEEAAAAYDAQTSGGISPEQAAAMFDAQTSEAPYVTPPLSMPSSIGDALRRLTSAENWNTTGRGFKAASGNVLQSAGNGVVGLLEALKNLPGTATNLAIKGTGSVLSNPQSMLDGPLGVMGQMGQDVGVHEGAKPAEQLAADGLNTAIATVPGLQATAPLSMPIVSTLQQMITNSRQGKPNDPLALSMGAGSQVAGLGALSGAPTLVAPVAKAGGEVGGGILRLLHNAIDNDIGVALTQSVKDITNSLMPKLAEKEFKGAQIPVQSAVANLQDKYGWFNDVPDHASFTSKISSDLATTKTAIGEITPIIESVPTSGSRFSTEIEENLRAQLQQTARQYGTNDAAKLSPDIEATIQSLRAEIPTPDLTPQIAAVDAANATVDTLSESLVGKTAAEQSQILEQIHKAQAVAGNAAAELERARVAADTIPFSKIKELQQRFDNSAKTKFDTVSNRTTPAGDIDVATANFFRALTKQKSQAAAQALGNPAIHNTFMALKEKARNLYTLEDARRVFAAKEVGLPAKQPSTVGFKKDFPLVRVGDYSDPRNLYQRGQRVLTKALPSPAEEGSILQQLHPEVAKQFQPVPSTFEGVTQNADGLVQELQNRISPQDAQIVIPQLQDAIEAADPAMLGSVITALQKTYPSTRALFSEVGTLMKNTFIASFGGRVFHPDDSEKVQRMIDQSGASNLDKAKATTALNQDGSISKAQEIIR